jgi:hypothetical protein
MMMYPHACEYEPDPYHTLLSSARPDGYDSKPIGFLHTILGKVVLTPFTHQISLLPATSAFLEEVDESQRIAYDTSDEDETIGTRIKDPVRAVTLLWLSELPSTSRHHHPDAAIASRPAV